MRGLGLFRMLEITLGLSMAGPMFVVGIDFLRTGQPVLGAGLFVAGVFALFFPSYLVHRVGGPRTWIRRRLGGGDTGHTRAESDSSSESARSGSGSGSDSGHSSLLDRL